MPATLSELMAALPAREGDTSVSAMPELLDRWSLRPVPIGRLRRLAVMGTLQAQIAAAYLFYWLRGWFRTADENKRLLAETHWSTALRVLDSMSYLRGAAMKTGQTLANFPDIAPREFMEALERLHFDAPPMHWSLLREIVHNELGDDPENLFAEFDKRAFAAASIGQVHRARLKTGELVAVKIQYPGIARTIRDDFRNLLPFLLPVRLSKDWENVKAQLDDLRGQIEREVDYAQEAANLERARALFRDEDGIVVPRVYRQLSSPRVLTMEHVDGLHMDEYLGRNPGQQDRDERARKLLHAWYRVLYAGRMLYADFHPGNFLFLDDGRVGVIDFGFMLHLDGEEWEMFRKMDRPLTTGDRAERIAAVCEWSEIGEHETEMIAFFDEWADWCWRSRYCGAAFDFGDEADFQRGIQLFVTAVRKRYSRGRPSTMTICRQHFGWRAILYRLGARADVRPIAEEEVKATGWDRSEYARP